MAALLACGTPPPPPVAHLTATASPTDAHVDVTADGLPDILHDIGHDDALADAVLASDQDADSAVDAGPPDDADSLGDAEATDAAGAIDVPQTLPPMPVPSQPVGLQAWFGGGTDDRLHAVVAMPAGGHALVGRTLDTGGGAADGVIIRMDPCGAMLWARTCGGLHDDDLVALLPVADGGLLVAGQTANNGVNDDMLVARLDAIGQPLWTRALGGAEDDAVVAIAPAPGGAAILGITRSFGGGAPPQWNALLVKLNDSGNLAWARSYWSTADTTPAGLVAVQGGNGGWLLLGDTLAATVGQHDAWLLRAAPDGMPLWTRTLGGPLDERLVAGVATADSGFLAVGRTRSFGAAQEDMLLLRLDGSGQVLWATRQGTAASDEARAIWPAGAGFVLAGTTEGVGGGGAKFIVQALDVAGTPLYGAIFGGAGSDVLSGAAPAADGGALLAGWRVTSTGGKAGVLVKTESPAASACASNDALLAAVALAVATQPHDVVTETSPGVVEQTVTLLWTQLGADFAHMTCATPCP